MDEKLGGEILKELKANALLMQNILEESKIINRKFPYFINYPRATVTIATPLKPSDPDVLATGVVPGGYDRIVVFHELNRLSPKCWIINDGDGAAGTPILYAISTSDGIKWSGESEILTHETRCFLNVYELRVRSPGATTVYRVTEYEPGAVV